MVVVKSWFLNKHRFYKHPMDKRIFINQLQQSKLKIRFHNKQFNLPVRFVVINWSIWTYCFFCSVFKWKKKCKVQSSLVRAHYQNWIADWNRANVLCFFILTHNGELFYDTLFHLRDTSLQPSVLNFNWSCLNFEVGAMLLLLLLSTNITNMFEYYTAFSIAAIFCA